MIFSNFGSMKGGTFNDDKGFFSNFQPVHQPQPQPQPQQQQQPQQFQYQRNNIAAHKRECNSDDVEVESRSTAGDDSLLLPPLASSTDPKKHKTKSAAAAADEAGSIEMVRRPRGRPLGSKNKPKPPAQANREAAAAENSEEPATMRPHVLEISPGLDIVDALARFSRRRELGISLLSGTGPVSNVTIREPSAAGGSTITFRGRFDILSISATFLPPSFSASSQPQALLVAGGMSISIAGPQGQIVGGSVSGPLVAAGTVMIVAASFSNPCFHRLPLEDEQSLSVSGDGTGGRSRTVDVETAHHRHNHHQQPFQQQQQQQHHGIGSGIVGPPSLSGMSAVYSGNLGNDVIWTPTAGGPPSLPPRY